MLTNMGSRELCYKEWKKTNAGAAENAFEVYWKDSVTLANKRVSVLSPLSVILSHLVIPIRNTDARPRSPYVTVTTAFYLLILRRFYRLQLLRRAEALVCLGGVPAAPQKGYQCTGPAVVQVGISGGVTPLYK